MSFDKPAGAFISLISQPPDQLMVPEAVQALVGAGVRINSVTQQKASLENYFLAVTGGEGIGGGSGRQSAGTASSEDQAA